MITVSCDIIAPFYWWKQFDTYKIGTVTDSCSTMHKIAEKEFVLNDFSCEYLFNGTEEGTEFLKDFMYTIKALNKAREKYLETKKKIYWWQMIQMLPTCYNQKRTVQLNYAVLKNMYHSRQNHKLDEWREFCKWVESIHNGKLTGPSAWDGYIACDAGDALNASRGTSQVLKVETMEKPEMYK